MRPGRSCASPAAGDPRPLALAMRSLVIALTLLLLAVPAGAARIKDISVLRGPRDSQLVGYGLVVGLSGTGDTFRNTPFTQEAVQGMLLNLGMDVHGVALRNRNVAAVIVSADLSAGVQAGSRLTLRSPRWAMRHR